MKRSQWPWPWSMYTELTGDTLKEVGDRAVFQRDKGDLGSFVPGRHKGGG